MEIGQYVPLAAVRAIVASQRPGDDLFFTRQWDRCLAHAVASFVDSPRQDRSRLSIQMEFLRRLCDTFPGLGLRTCTPLLNLLLTGAPAAGATVTLPGGRRGLIVHRQVSVRFTLLYTVRLADGGLVDHELLAGDAANPLHLAADDTHTVS